MMMNKALAPILVFLGVIFAALVVFYLTTKTSFLATSYAIHHKHALFFAVLAICAFVGANFARKRALTA